LRTGASRTVFRNVSGKEKAMKQLNPLDWLALVVLILGGLNWGLVGLFTLNPVELFSGEVWYIPRVVYIVFGLSALYIIRISFRLRKKAKE
jgi:uncharacterized membrane protein YuzA (DUF378 family)